MENVVGQVHQFCDYDTRVFTVNWGPDGAVLINNLNRRLHDGIIRARGAEEEMRAVKTQLKEIADRIDGQKTAWPAPGLPAGASGSAGANTSAISKRFKGRFREIDSESDGLMGQCRITAEEQQQTSNLFMAENLEARSKSKQAPRTSEQVSSNDCNHFSSCDECGYHIAVPAFKYENDWLEVRFRPVNGSESHDGSSRSPSDSINPVFSGYGIIFIVISVCLSYFTCYTYLSATRRLE